MRMPRTKTRKKNPHRKPFKEIKGGLAPERAAELLAAAKRADIIHLRYNGGTWIDFTEEKYDKFEGVKK